VLENVTLDEAGTTIVEACTGVEIVVGPEHVIAASDTSRVPPPDTVEPPVTVKGVPVGTVTVTPVAIVTAAVD
jgi:hypothetical protein